MTLARALYSRASILLLDDVLAALDVHTAKAVVEDALQGQLVEGRTVILVTHNIALAAPIADLVLVLGRHGTVTGIGSVSEMLKKDPRLRAQVESRETMETVETVLDETTNGKDESNEPPKSAGKLVVAEDKATGHVEWSAVKLYLNAVGSSLVWIIAASLRWAGILVGILQTWILGYWSAQYETHDASEVHVLGYVAPLMPSARRKAT